jgi:hypothetical protein
VNRKRGRISRRPLRGIALVLLSLLLVSSLPGCSTVRAPVLTDLQNVSAREIVILVPGMTGTQLRERDSGHVVWGDSHSLLAPKDGGRAMALSIDDPQGSAARLEPFSPVYKLSMLGITREIYGPLARLFDANGYRTGALNAPDAGGNFFFFNYDWRLSAAHAARSLTVRLEALQRAGDGGPLRVTLICQSSAALIGRYLVKYGAVSLEQAESGEVATPGNVTVSKLIMVGASNGGALRVLRQMNEGRSYVRLFGRRMQPETLFTMPSLYEGLPVYEQQLFYDSEGRLLDVDLFDAASWEQYAWSIFAPKTRQRIARPEWTELIGDDTARRDYLQSMLDRARRLHALLSADPPDFEPPRYYSFQNNSSDTGERALLVERKGGWETLFLDHRTVQRVSELLELAAAPGDTHATVRSQEWLSPKERSALAHPAVYTAGGHFDVILDPGLQEQLLKFLLE